MLIPRKKDMLSGAPRDGRGGVDASALAIAALGFIAADEDRLGDFLALSGLTVDGLRAAAARPGFLIAVLEFILQDDLSVLAFATSEGVDPASIAPALRQLQRDAGMTPVDE